MNRFKSASHKFSSRYLGLLLAIIVIGLIGTWLLLISRASAPNVGVESEDGTTSGCITRRSDGGASQKKIIKFGGCPSTPFVHPGILLGTDQLAATRQHVVNGDEPWATFFTKMQTSKAQLGDENGTAYASLSYTPHPSDHILCASGNSTNASAACNDEQEDAMAAYAAALMYSYGSSNRDAYAQQSIKILNSWAAVLRHCDFNDAATKGADYLYSSWSGSLFARTAEIMRYTYTPPTGEKALNISNLNAMFAAAFVPNVQQVWPGGAANWQMSFDEAAMSIAIFTDDHTLYNNAIERWKIDVPSIIYMNGDINPYPNLAGLPIPPPNTTYDKPSTDVATIKQYWHNPSSFMSGLEQETCRDPAHMSMGFGPMINVAESARLQGVDLYNYSDFETRIPKGVEMNAAWIKQFLDGSKPPNWPCKTTIVANADYGWQAVFEAAYNAYHNRLGLPMPNANALLTTYSRKSQTQINHEMAWEALTNYGAP